MNPIASIHDGYVFNRRVRVLAGHLCKIIPQDVSVLDIGCGDGTLTRALCEQRPDLTAEGIDVLVRKQTRVPVKEFDGDTIPRPDNSFDIALFVDVLHHTNDPTILLREAARVARRAIVLKDHTRNGFLAGPTLRFMDWVGNARHGVALPYNYWPEKKWRETFDAMNFTIAEWLPKLSLYPAPASWFFDRSLHFIARLDLPSDAPEPPETESKT